MARKDFDFDQSIAFTNDASSFTDFATIPPAAGSGFDAGLDDPFGGTTVPISDMDSNPVFESTMPADVIQKGSRRVVGWLVCTKGETIGKDYHLHSEYNYIGRSTKHDVIIPDPKVSSDAMCWISYDRIGREFTIGLGDHPSNVTRLNNKPVYMPQPLKPYDRILLGDTELMFVPLCSDEFAWEEDE